MSEEVTLEYKFVRVKCINETVQEVVDVWELTMGGDFVVIRGIEEEFLVPTRSVEWIKCSP